VRYTLGARYLSKNTVIRPTKDNAPTAKKEIRKYIEFELEVCLSFTPGIFYIRIIRYVERQRNG